MSILMGRPCFQQGVVLVEGRHWLVCVSASCVGTDIVFTAIMACGLDGIERCASSRSHPFSFPNSQSVPLCRGLNMRLANIRGASSK
ncbi:uncharacterized protein EI90DRAFT_3047809 [Cantharellus anzutake]|uniref:uncharacterized protein n=1 Tax=Cantharellus anzutake TaxID=1750568 RepID=UPI00190593A0|nr:uncharacterized protein EI90DRAFT_3061580 [Cantharellus anzutake]XP_038918513.1 uncharacterized protein EI90DRAFT_3047809 [Cantharellus anzutake]KAF8329699.1 hypothetical protein EI90DRAFT_3061580 [Cantharellus anzutake]KAF8335290.1 hypothetical protein EI90DRAFT_3047809 [Cantharellus anzutake]